MTEAIARGKKVVEHLARRFPQLYVAPAEGARESHGLACRFGVAPEGANLEHFETDDEDELREVATPAGPVDVAFFKNRACFETFLQVIGHKAEPVPIAPTIGAVTYRGLADWGAVASEVHGAVVGIEELSRKADLGRPFDFLVELKKDALLTY